MGMMNFKVEKRVETSRLLYIFYIGAMILGMLAASLFFSVRGINPLFALSKIFMGAFGSALGIRETIAKSIPLMLCATGLIIAFRGKFWNIGAEGQLLIGAMFATWIGLRFGASHGPLFVIPLMFLSGFAGGALWGIIPAVLKVKFGVNEVIATIMLNYIASNLIQYLVYGPWKGKTHYGFPYTDDFAPSARLPLIPGTRIHYYTLIIAILIAIATHFFINRVKYGYEIKVTGENPEAARYSGMNFLKITIITLILSGGFAGIAGVGEVAGIHFHLTYPDQISAGYGFTAIIIAWLSRLNPLLAIFVSFFFGGILVGGDVIQTSFGLPAATINIFNSLILIFVLMGTFFMEYRVSFAKE